MGKIFDIISGLVFVPRCCSCNRIIKSDNNCFCDDCNKNIHIIEGKVCGVCGQPLPDYFESPICGRCRNLKHYFNKNISLFKYNDESKNVALNLKYKNYSFIRPVAGLLGDKIKQNVQIDAVTFVPMYKEEELKKGICITYF
ncbi:MAG: double zinc ribbon domain-containing protein, partial [Bacillota bacterium]|nr:double zinc ribbon domain-containing protein [Bacillota bacterium]